MIVRRVIGIVLFAVGAVWFLQGVGIIGGSFMTNSTTWLVIGAVVGILGAVMVALPRKRF